MQQLGIKCILRFALQHESTGLSFQIYRKTPKRWNFSTCRIFAIKYIYLKKIKWHVQFTMIPSKSGQGKMISFLAENCILSIVVFLWNRLTMILSQWTTFLKTRLTHSFLIISFLSYDDSAESVHLSSSPCYYDIWYHTIGGIG